MKRIYIFGVGKGKEIVRENLLEDRIELVGYIDNNAQAYPDGIDGKKVFLLEEIDCSFDYIIVSVMRYRHVNDQLFAAGIYKDKIINFFSFDDAKTEKYWSILNKNGWRIEAMAYEFEKNVRPYPPNMIYELGDIRTSVKLIYPKILPAQEAIELLCKEKKSLARYGADEFELMQMRNRSRYQLANKELAKRLREVIKTQRQEILIAIADNYGSLENYTKEAAEDIRAYMSPQVRQEHMEQLNLQKIYYDAYLSRPYIIYKDKDKAGKRFELLRQLWSDREVLIVEGCQTRMGVGNDLLDNARSVKRIIAPSENAFDKYYEIVACVRNIAKEELILLALGATATVLAFDLACAGLWAIDIGHLDLEYEWYHLEAKETKNIPYKYVNEVNRGNQVSELPHKLRQKYEKEIVWDLT